MKITPDQRHLFLSMEEDVWKPISGFLYYTPVKMQALVDKGLVERKDEGSRYLFRRKTLNEIMTGSK